MQGITYEWNISFALIVSVLGLVATITLWKLKERKEVNRCRKQAYEEIYGDVRFILEFPTIQCDKKIKQIIYINENPELQKAVRLYIDSHWMDQAWGTAKFIPPHITDERQKLQFVQLVQDEAIKFSDKLFAEKSKLSIPELSPVFHLDEPEIDKRLKRIIEHIGQNFSLFSEDIGRLWERARISNPFDIRGEYEKAFQVCKNYFNHNPRGFEDPFHDLVKRICEEYRLMTRTRKQKIEELIWRLKLLSWKIRHPIKYYRIIKDRWS